MKLACPQIWRKYLFLLDWFYDFAELYIDNAADYIVSPLLWFQLYFVSYTVVNRSEERKILK